MYNQISSRSALASRATLIFMTDARASFLLPLTASGLSVSDLGRQVPEGSLVVFGVIATVNLPFGCCNSLTNINGVGTLVLIGLDKALDGFMYQGVGGGILARPDLALDDALEFWR
jgi:hypothetical protein